MNDNEYGGISSSEVENMCRLILLLKLAHILDSA
jgi:hypothetical protein